MRIASLTVLIAFCSSSCYTLKQAWYQNNLINSRRPIEELLKGDDLVGFERKGLLLVKDILKFAQDQGLEAHDTYRYYIRTDRKAISYLVSASEPCKMKLIKFWFPIIGSFPYLGFFAKIDRDDKAEKLIDQGYDVATSTASAFSGLGFFEDPIYSSMLQRSRVGLAYLLFHELTHRTLWFKGHVRFNENLAEFVGSILTIKYLKRFNDQKEVNTFLAQMADRRLYREWLQSLKNTLEQLYERQKKESREVILNRKAKIIEEFQTKKLPRFTTRRFNYVAKKKWNNASILGAYLYAYDSNRFMRAYSCLKEEPISGFLTRIAKMMEEYDDPYEALDRICV